MRLIACAAHVVARLVCQVVFIAALVMPFDAKASNVQFVGTVSYTYVENVATFTANRVENFDFLGYSGTLKMESWAFASPFTGSLQLGYRLAEYTLGQLFAGYHYSNVYSGAVYFLPPPNGVWWFTMVLTDTRATYLTVATPPGTTSIFRTPS